MLASLPNSACNINNPPCNALSFFSLNARSLFNKMDELRSLDLPHLIGISESWCVDTEPDSIYDLPGYNILRCDPKSGPGGGVVMYIQSSISYEFLSDVEVAGFEVVWIRLGGPTGSVIVGCVYRPPRSIPSDFCQGLETALGKCQSLAPHLVLLGDTNCKHRTWYSTTILPADAFLDAAGENLHLLTESFGLSQAVHFPTYLYPGQPHSCLDQVFSSFAEEYVQVSSAAPLGSSDHVIVQGQLPCSFEHLHHAEPVISQRWCWYPDPTF